MIVNPTRRLPERRATDKPCRACGKPIQPGQLWVPRRTGPLHVYCGQAKR